MKTPNKTSPLAVTKKEASRLIGSTKIVQRMIHATRHARSKESTWLTIVLQGGRGRSTLVEYESLEKAIVRMKSGEQPPLLPSELKAVAKKKGVSNK